MLEKESNKNDQRRKSVNRSYNIAKRDEELSLRARQDNQAERKDSPRYFEGYNTAFDICNSSVKKQSDCTKKFRSKLYKEWSTL